jgi:hypothetical protein
MVGALMSHMLNYTHMDDLKIEALRNDDVALAEAIVAVFSNSQNLPVIVF